MRVLITGSRDYTRGDIIEDCIRACEATLIIQGGQRGADQLAILAATRIGIPYLTFWADWKKHGKAAGPLRNQQMIDEGKPDIVLAFPLPGSRGTWDMIRRARKAGIIFRVFE